MHHPSAMVSGASYCAGADLLVIASNDQGACGKLGGGTPWAPDTAMASPQRCHRVTDHGATVCTRRLRPGENSSSPSASRADGAMGTEEARVQSLWCNRSAHHPLKPSTSLHHGRRRFSMANGGGVVRDTVPQGPWPPTATGESQRGPRAGCGGPGRPKQKGSIPTENERGRNTAHSRSPMSDLRKIRMSPNY